MEISDSLVRCEWCVNDQDYIQYHDKEWGVPLHDDQKLFELLTLEGAQAGLSWLTVLRRRDGYRRAFKNFNILQVSKFNDLKIANLLNDTGIIRNKLKVLSTVSNAKAILIIQKEFGSFDKYLWQYIDNVPINNGFSKSSKPGEIADLLSKDLRRRGMNFVGPTICYAFMQASGMINDHVTNCFRFSELS